MNQPKQLNFKKIIIRAVILASVGCLIWFFAALYKGIRSFDTYPPIELDTAEKEEYYTQIFHIKDTDNIGSYTAYFHEGIMTIILNDVTDLHDLCFENLAYYGFTQDDYNAVIKTDEEYEKMINTPPEQRGPDHSIDRDENPDAMWNFARVSAEYRYWEIRFRDRSDNYTIIIKKAKDKFRCEINTGWGDREIMKKLKEQG